MSLTAVVQHHPARAHLIPDLVERLAPLPTIVSTHSSSPPNPWEGYQLALRAGIAAETSHILVVQDDAYPCGNFAPAAEQIAEANPDCPVTLFIACLPKPTVRLVMEASKRKERYAEMRLRDFVPVIALLWPRHRAEQFLAWTTARYHKLPGYPKTRSDDAVVGRWMMESRQRVRVTIPSLVEHPDVEPSLIGRRSAWGRDKGRIALNFIGDGDPLQFDWSK